jgi:hypothetical protein
MEAMYHALVARSEAKAVRSSSKTLRACHHDTMEGFETRPYKYEHLAFVVNAGKEGKRC